MISALTLQGSDKQMFISGEIKPGSIISFSTVVKYSDLTDEQKLVYDQFDTLLGANREVIINIPENVSIDRMVVDEYSQDVVELELTPENLQVLQQFKDLIKEILQ